MTGSITDTQDETTPTPIHVFGPEAGADRWARGRLAAMRQSTKGGALDRGLAHRREEHDLADRAPAREEHHEAVDPDADPARRRHPVLEREQVRLVERLRLLVARRRVTDLLLEAPPLVVGIVELGERVADLHPADDRLEALDEALLGAVALGERRELDRVVEQERGLDEVRLDVLGDQVVDELAPGLLLGDLEPALAHPGA